MNETNFKILMHCGHYVDINLLEKGIYTTSKPYLFDKNETIEKMVKTAEDIQDKMGNWHFPEKYFESLKQCKLVDVQVLFQAVP